MHNEYEYESKFFSHPQAYRLRQANSVKIAKIVACTVILSSLILGSFMLASTYLQAKATCDQVSALDAILEKELMLESMQQQQVSLRKIKVAIICNYLSAFHYCAPSITTFKLFISSSSLLSACYVLTFYESEIFTLKTFPKLSDDCLPRHKNYP